MAHTDNDFGPSLPGVFDFTILFEQSILSLLPASIFILVAPLRTWTLVRRDTIVRSRNLFLAKQATIAVYSCLQLALVALWSLPSTPRTKTSIAEAVIGVVEAGAICALSWAEHYKSVRPSVLLNLYLLLSTLLDTAAARTYLTRPGLAAIGSVSLASLAVKAALLTLEESPKDPARRDKTTADEAAAGVVSRGVFWWLNPLLLVGAKTLLAADHVGPIEDKFDSARLLRRLESVWDNDGKTGSWALMKCTFLAYKWQFLAGVLPRLLFTGFTFAQPFLINAVVDFVGAPGEQQTAQVAASLVGATVLVYVGIAVCSAAYRHMTYQLLTMYRGGLASLVFKKTLRLEASSVRDSAPVTLMSTDIESIVMSGDAIHDIWASFIEIPLAIYLLYRNVGIPSLFILIPAFCTSAAGALISPAMGPARVQWNKAIQERVGSVSTMLSQIKGVKMMGLTVLFHDSLQTLRIHELKLAVRFRWILVQLNCLAMASEDLTPVIVIVAAIFWTKADEGLTVAEAFTSLSIISIAETPLVNILISIVQLFGAIGCFSRLQAFLVMDERRDLREMAPSTASSTPSTACLSSITLPPVDDASKDADPASNIALAALEARARPSLDPSIPAVAIESATFTVGENVKVLADISMVFPRGTVSMIVGRVGCGKSSLLKAIAGELSLARGRLVADVSSMAYCDQTPWLQNCSIRDNIAAQSPLDEAWLHTVIEACALDEDISMLPARDFTIVGSGGVALSGGQKQRVALARAVYSRRSVLLLDDVFSGLDSTTSRAVFQRVLGRDGLVRRWNATVIMATNHVNFLPAADHITVLGDRTTVRNQVRFNSVDPSEWGILESDTDSTTTVSGPDGAGLEPAKVSQEAAADPSRKTEADLCRQTGDLDCYRIYVRSLGTVAMVMLLVGSVLHTAMVKMPQVWLKLWTQKGTGPTDYAYMAGYIGFALASTTFGALNMGYYSLVGVPKSAIRLHDMLLRCVVRAPLHFFASTDSGITLNRFSQDMTLIDNALPMAFLNVTTLSLRALAETGLIASGASSVAAAIPVCFLALYLIQKYYLRTSRQLRLLDLEAKSPLYTQFAETLAGLPTIRAFGWAPAFRADNHRRLDASQRPFYTMFCVQRWLQVVLDLFVAGVALVLVALALRAGGSSSSSAAVGLAMVNLIGFNQTLAEAVDQWTRLETSLGAVARLKWFAGNTPDEDGPARHHRKHASLPPAWPDRGAIALRNLVAAYRHSEPVLKGVSLTIQPGQKVGVCGRSGSGKSSLVLALARLLDIRGGSITIDAQDLALLPRETVRRRLTALPQDGVRLRGTARRNLDPFGRYAGADADAPLEQALRKTGVWAAVARRGGLDADMAALGLSAGQAQLFFLARALLLLGGGGGALVLLDEATSCVDAQTDDAVRAAIRDDLRGRTVVAHRLDVLRACDVVVVMATGQVVEVGEPEALLAKGASAFKALWDSRRL
ncbi:ABC transporter, transmembrane domain, type 1 [Metarhizium robertsii ARSEF 23]|uniref:ABC transporter, transmembrane domain, type 1 n=1 Tax=Metarhizium robertsii (strain ARSEF 23 / ATCC MYA-3075) TaxID=655844 RepID=E9F9Z7_METRA|nr:ABC transporter, transmembrane domain, type 1 [Metarhizium robertsii ARSEF 23]EFY95497.2 ABC transporter, transmembrane domain, type 1 [Metarhizium robertsii ARSEF 23]